MRIRTIKPEFWISESIAPLSDFAKLLAIGLLNYADDDGYFWANPVLIRAAIFPFQDKAATIEKALAELVSVGFITTGINPEGRAVGLVKNFKLHQRIDRPKPSVISQNVTFDDRSTINQRELGEGSLLEGKGREQGREQGTPSAGVVDEVRKLPLFIDTKITGSTVVPASLAKSIPFLEVWKSWLEHLKQKRKPATLHAQDLQLRRLAEWGEERAIAAIRISIEKNWQSIYEDTTNGDNRTTSKPDRNSGTSNAGRIGQYDGIGKVR